MYHIRKLLFLVISVICLGPAAVACRCDLLPPLDSLSQIAQYDFIALVKITGDRDLRQATRDQEAVGELTFAVIERFKGYSNNKVLEYLKYTSCDMGVDTAQEWLLFAKMVDGKLGIYPCDRNQLHQDQNGQKDWQYGRGMTNLKILRKWYNHPVKQFGTEKLVQFYPNGQKEIEENYVNGQLQGERTIWYADGTLYGHENYSNGLLSGKAEWYYPTGQLSNEAYYSKGKHCNVSRFYSQVADVAKWKSGDLSPTSEIVYDAQGREIHFRQYYPPGRLKQESFYEPDSNFQTVIYYHDNGNVSFIGYYKNFRSYGEHWEYSKEGFPQKHWIYNKEGKLEKFITGHPLE